ncbi:MULTISPECIES: hypothetical protein [unclassified Streptomyces]|uniref:hypothetical protein n=1 Tax=unclassified Streptomyces TaxID=2593676 RepID=UPI0035DEE94B
MVLRGDDRVLGVESDLTLVVDDGAAPRAVPAGHVRDGLLERLIAGGGDLDGLPGDPRPLADGAGLRAHDARLGLDPVIGAPGIRWWVTLSGNGLLLTGILLTAVSLRAGRNRQGTGTR